MANQEHVERLQKGVALWNEWRKQYPEIRPDLSAADLSAANLRDVDLRDADLRRVNLSYADLSAARLNFANLVRADLSAANLSAANLYVANLTSADLSAADLSAADLHFVDLTDTKLNHTNVEETILFATILADLDLRSVRGLATVNHQGRSRVELYTVQLPPDGSALHFLQGAGVPDEWINFWRSTMMHPIHYHSLFISYSSKDEALARRLHADFQNHGVRCWFAPEDMKIGDKIRVRIDEAIHLQEKLLLLLSEHSLTSIWVEDEVEAAIEKEQKQQYEVLFPVRLDEGVMQTSQAWAAKLRRTRHIGDFTNWTDPQAYQQAFERLLRDLRKTDREAIKNGEN